MESVYLEILNWAMRLMFLLVKRNEADIELVEVATSLAALVRERTPR